MNPRSITPRAALLALLVLGNVGARAADSEIYRSTDAEGRVIYSDRKSDTAEPVKVAPTNTMPELVPAPIAPAPAEAEEPPAPAAPYSLQITDPADPDAAIAPNGVLRVNVSLDPPLEDGHELRLLLDDQPSVPANGAGFDVPAVSRGAHTIEVLIVDEDGALIQRSGTMEVQVIRPGRGGVQRLRPG